MMMMKHMKKMRAVQKVEMITFAVKREELHKSDNYK